MSAPAPASASASASASAPVTRSKRKAADALPASPASPTVPSAPKKNKTGAPAKASAKASAKAKAQAKAKSLDVAIDKYEKEGWPLSTAIPKSLDSALKKKEKLPPIHNQETVLVDFFVDYLNTIRLNIEEYLKAGDSGKTVDSLSKLKITNGGFDRAFQYTHEKGVDFNRKKVTFNLDIYNRLFTQFAKFGNPGSDNKENGMRLNGGTKLRLNLLISYLGKAVLRLVEKCGGDEKQLKELYSKIVVVLELAVEPNIFLHFMKQAKNKTKYKVIRERSQEYFGIYKKETWDDKKDYDAGIRKFVLNYVRRLIIYMKTYDKEYDLGYEKPYNYSSNSAEALTFPLPEDGVYKYAEYKPHFRIHPLDFDFIPDALLIHYNKLPATTNKRYQFKHYFDPTESDRSKSAFYVIPDKDWVKEAVELFGGEWWKMPPNVVEARSTYLLSTKEQSQWTNLHMYDKEEYDEMLKTWYDEYGEDYDENGLLRVPEAGAGAGAGAGGGKRKAKPKPKVAKPKTVAKPKAKKQ